MAPMVLFLITRRTSFRIRTAATARRLTSRVFVLEKTFVQTEIAEVVQYLVDSALIECDSRIEKMKRGYGAALLSDPDFPMDALREMEAAGLPLCFGNPRSSEKKARKKAKECKRQTKKERFLTERRLQKQSAVLSPMGVDPKYWYQRYRFWSLFDAGILMDAEGWFSVTPESISIHIARRCRHCILDAFAGCGGNAIQFAKFSPFVIAVDIDAEKLRFLRHNASIYGVSPRIDCLLCDCRFVIPRVSCDVVFLSPPWGGPEYLLQDSFSMAQLGDLDFCSIVRQSLAVAPRVVLLCPRNVDREEIVTFGGEGTICEFEECFINNKLKVLVAYFGFPVSPSSLADVKEVYDYTNVIH